MDFLPTQDQLDLTAAVRDLLETTFDRSRLAAVNNGFDPVLWRSLVEMGVFSLRIPESEGGLGLGWTETALVTEELGRACVPGPVIASLLAPELGIEPGVVTTLVDLRQDPVLVSHLESSAHLLLLHAGGVSNMANSLRGTTLSEPVDPHTPLTRIAENVTATGGAHDLELHGAMLTAAFQVGIARKTTDLAVRYALEREQFGRQIGGFQAVKHLCADMLARAELASAAVHAAALALDGASTSEPPRAVFSAKILADEAAVANCRSAIQVHGGMGFTWEVELHWYLKRAWVLCTEWGSSEDHSEQLARIL